MALIKNLTVSHAAEEKSIRSETEATYTTFLDKSNKRFAQITTTGSARRRFSGVINQNIQVDEKIAQKLVDALKKTFPGIK